MRNESNSLQNLSSTLNNIWKKAIKPVHLITAGNLELDNPQHVMSSLHWTISNQTLSAMCLKDSATKLWDGAPFHSLDNLFVALIYCYVFSLNGKLLWPEGEVINSLHFSISFSLSGTWPLRSNSLSSVTFLSWGMLIMAHF